jgi:hypothetical protein
MSKIEVNTIEPQCGTTLTVGKCNSNVTVPSNVVKTNAVQASDGGSIISQSGTTITLGASGDTIALASGASQTGFGRTGTVDWQTGDIKTATFTAVNGQGFFANTTGGAFNMNLPAGSAGAIVSVADYAATWNSNGLTVVPNGTDKMGGINANVSLGVQGQSVTFVFVDSTQGWVNTMDSTSNARASNYITASGGNSTATCGDFKIHTFTGPGTFCVSAAGGPSGSNGVEYIVVAGGGSGIGGGGGGGGFRFASPSLSPATYPAKPLAAPANLQVTVQGYPITVGAGGTSGDSGSNSIFSSITSTGGGRGAAADGAGSPSSYNPSAPGGSGGGAGHDQNTAGGNGNTPPVSPPQGQNGGTAPAGGFGAGGGGGGAITVGSTGGGPGNPASGGPGGPGAGVPNAFGTSGHSSGGFYVFSGGGGGGGNTTGSAGGGSGGSGGGGGGSGPQGSTGSAGTVNTGGGGGGNEYCAAIVPNSNSGGSGIVIIRYKFQN